VTVAACSRPNSHWRHNGGALDGKWLHCLNERFPIHAEKFRAFFTYAVKLTWRKENIPAIF